MLQRCIEVIDTRTDFGISLNPITNDNADDYGRLLLPPDEETTTWLFESDKKMLEHPTLLQYYLDEQEMWAIEVDGAAIGISSLWALDDEYPGVSTFITKAPHLRHGVGTMAIAGLVSSNVFDPKLTPEFAKPFVKTHIRNDNVAITRTLQKIGFWADDTANLDADLNWDGASQWLLANPDKPLVCTSWTEFEKARQSQDVFANLMSGIQVTTKPRH